MSEINNTMNAEQALNISLQVLEKKHKDLLSRIISEIKKSCDDGELFIIGLVDNEKISYEVSLLLRDRGFHVHQYMETTFNKIQLKISWDK